MASNQQEGLKPAERAVAPTAAPREMEPSKAVQVQEPASSVVDTSGTEIATTTDNAAPVEHQNPVASTDAGGLTTAPSLAAVQVHEPTATIETSGTATLTNPAPAAGNPQYPQGYPPSAVSSDAGDHLFVDNDDDSAIGIGSTGPSTTSVRSSLYDNVEENGRTYHRYREGKYFLPNDEKEQDRLDLQHHMFRMSLDGKLLIAPIGPSPQRVLDIATGTGLWAIEFAEEYPSADVTGTDLSLMQPEFVPPNCHFEIDDAEDEWIFARPFDYIHARAIVSCFADHRSIIQKAYDNLVPGGYLELQDGILPIRFIDSSGQGTALELWNKCLVEATTKAGKPWTGPLYYQKWMQEVGFEDVVQRKFYWPLNPWPKGKALKERATWANANFTDGIEGWSMALFTRLLGWTKEEVIVFAAKCRDDLRNRNIHSYALGVAVYGRKPLA